ncbi:MAG: hypothetical protein HN919_12255 [Verrucomicrobia bacterium]|jgi:hypothetical protein|nr:hypothetical protein [Verrucomicrobiota bacterium]MBT7067070.1 hypothetical protein [Verrucomicrobiota bacterium]MBT7700030.1 hypothetical protein [Verrucomicrobiota bacterium]
MRSANAQLAWDTIRREPRKGIPIWLINPMEWTMIDRLAGMPGGSYEADPIPTYRRMLENSSCSMVDQWIPENPLTIGAHGYEPGAEHGATTGAEQIVVDGQTIAEPEDVVAHMESNIFPELLRAIEAERVADGNAAVAGIIQREREAQEEIGPSILKVPYSAPFPCFAYGTYGYVNYFMAYALYPELMEQHFKLQADLAALQNRNLARAMDDGGLPKYLRLDHDMADSRSTLADIDSLDRIWFPHFARSIQPLLDADVTMIWHCDGNLMAMVPRLLECGLRGFQGFQYEDGMDYQKICAMKDRDGRELLIIAGVSVTRTLPHGTPDDVRDEMRFLVEHGPKQGLFLGGSSSIAPGVPWENLKALVDGFAHYRRCGRG